MKKSVQMLLLQGLFLLTITFANAQQITDVNLKNAILRSCPTCLDNSGYLLPKARTVTALQLRTDYYSTAVRTSKGLEGFTSVDEIYFSSGSGSANMASQKIDSLPPNLSKLILSESSYEKIDKLPSTLTDLFIESYIDSVLPQFPTGLTFIKLTINNVKTLPVLPSGLTFLSLKEAEKLIALPELPTTLKDLVLDANFNGNFNTKLTRLPILPPQIEYINLSSFEKLVYIPNLPNSLKAIDIFNQDGGILEQLPTPLPKQLNRLYLRGTKVKCLGVLPNNLTELKLFYNDITCVPNVPISTTDIGVIINNVLITNKADLPICNGTNSICQFPAFVSGNVYRDLNVNGVKNSNEPIIKQLLIKSTDGNLTTLTDTSGNYILIGDSLKTYTFSPVFSNNYFKTVPLSRIITTTNAIAQRFDSLDFAIQSLGTFPDIATSITLGEARPGFNSISTLTYKNVGTTILNGTITLTLDAKQTFVSADVMPTQNGNVLTWNYTNLQPFDFKNINITLKTLVNAPLSSLAISTVNGTITGATDANPLNNSETTQITVRGSYDPNDKQVDKVGIPTVTAIATTPLTYTIRFQNTGNAEAIRVEVVDTLTKKLDITTIEMLGASHPYEMKIVSDSGKVKDFTVVKWTFDGIYLPDSTSNEKGSHGFIKYRIKNDTKKMGLTVDSILNKAAIYFDFNPPIITNIARTLFNPRVATVELKDLGLNVFPNPVSNILTISSTHKNEQELTIEVVNTNGQVLMHQILRGQNPQINVHELAAGLYFLKIKTSEGIGVVKIIKQ